MRRDRWFGFAVPTEAPDVDPSLLDPTECWPDRTLYDDRARQLVALFRENFRKYEADTLSGTRNAGPAPP